MCDFFRILFFYSCRVYVNSVYIYIHTFVCHRVPIGWWAVVKSVRFEGRGHTVEALPWGTRRLKRQQPLLWYAYLVMYLRIICIIIKGAPCDLTCCGPHSCAGLCSMYEHTHTHTYILSVVINITRKLYFLMGYLSKSKYTTGQRNEIIIKYNS